MRIRSHMNNNSPRVLIIDDMPVNRMILSSLLASGGVISDQGDGGLMCLDMVRDNDYDLILLDHRMPEPDGVDTLIQLKEIFKAYSTKTDLELLLKEN